METREAWIEQYADLDMVVVPGDQVQRRSTAGLHCEWRNGEWVCENEADRAEADQRRH